MKTITLDDVGLDLTREPLARPFGFKGRAFREKWVCRAKLVSSTGAVAEGIGGLAVLWSDEAVFSDHTEVGGNLIMAAMLEHGLRTAAGRSFTTPPELLAELAPPVGEYGITVTGRPDLRKTFVYNSLVALDNAAWRLYALENDIGTFDELIPEAYRPAFDYRHTELLSVPTISYSTPVEEIRRLVEGGQFVLKVKIGASGDPGEMLSRDKERLSEIHAAVGELELSQPPGEKVRYYLDANGRYQSRRQVEELLDTAERIGALDQIVLFEEPFPEDSTEDLSGLPVRFAADESLHDVEDMAAKLAQGFRAVALKPAGKTLSVTLAMAAEARRLDIPCFVADSTCLPRSVDWNRNVAARLAPLPELGPGLLESNGPESYGPRWEELLAEHPCSPAPWLTRRHGSYTLDDSFYQSGGGIFEPL
ncbi:MAG: enolase C-terminal domain-like protein [Verrucomicrobiales bacterium]